MFPEYQLLRFDPHRCPKGQKIIKPVAQFASDLIILVFWGIWHVKTGKANTRWPWGHIIISPDPVSSTPRLLPFEEGRIGSSEHFIFIQTCKPFKTGNESRWIIIIPKWCLAWSHARRWMWLGPSHWQCLTWSSRLASYRWNTWHLEIDILEAWNLPLAFLLNTRAWIRKFCFVIPIASPASSLYTCDYPVASQVHINIFQYFYNNAIVTKATS